MLPTILSFLLNYAFRVVLLLKLVEYTLISSKLLLLSTLHEYVSYITSLTLSIIVFCTDFNESQLNIISYTTISVCLSFLIWKLFGCYDNVIQLDINIVTRRYISDILLAYIVILSWSSSNLLYFISTATIIICRNKVLRIAQILESKIITKAAFGKYLFCVFILHVFFVNLQSTCFILLDLALSMLFSFIDYNTSNMIIITISINFGFNIKDKDIKKLIKMWQTNSNINTRDLYAKQLLTLKDSKKLNKKNLDEIIHQGTQNMDFISPSFITLVLPVIDQPCVNAEFKTKLMNTLTTENNIGKMPISDLVNLSNITHEKNQIILEHSFNIFRNPKYSINDRLYVSNAMVKQLHLNPDFLNQSTVVKTYKTIANKPKLKFDSKELLLSSVALQCLKKVQDDLPFSFYKSYYLLNIHANLNNGKNAAELTKLRNRIENHDVTNEEKFILLETLSVLLYNYYKVDTSIFTNFVPRDWSRELLVYVLLGNSIQADTENWNEKKVKEFMKEMHLLNEFVKENWKEDSLKMTKDVLKSLINKQHQNKFSLTQVINILTVVRAHTSHINTILQTDSGLIEELSNMEDTWLKKTCVEKSIDISERSMNMLEPQNPINQLRSLLVSYDVRTITGILEKVKNKCNVSDLVSFFALLDRSQLSDHNKRLFLAKLRPSTVFTWKENLSSLIVRLLITSEFPEYRGEVSDAINPIKSPRFSSIKKQFNKIFNKSNHNSQTKFIEASDDGKIFLNNHFKLKSDRFYRTLTTLLRQVETKMSRLLSHEQWSLARLAFFIQILDSLEKIEELDKALDIIVDYNLNEDEGINDTIDNSSTTDLEANVLYYALQQKFSGTYDKKPTDLLQELNEINDSNNIGFLKQLSSAIKEVNDAFNGNSTLVNSNRPIMNWKDEDINLWVEQLQVLISSNDGYCVSQSEKIAVIKRALELTNKSKIEIRSIQIMSVLLLLNTEKGKGRLAQINTGEGKTNIIAMVAAYHGLHKHQVDIVTTSPVLAIPQCENMKPFYAKLQLTVSHNFENPDGYKSNIVYGPILDFEADVLRDECIDTSKVKRRRGRKYDIIIVDEVDSMFIDGNDHIVMLASTMPGMNHLEPLLAAIVMQVDSVSSCVKNINGVPHYMQTKSRINSDGTLNSEEEVEAIPLDCSLQKFIHDATEKHLRKLVRDEKDEEPGYPRIDIPNHLKEFVCKLQIPKWIDSAISAKHVYENKKHYVIRKGKVMPVDAQNTGVVHENQHWSNGIHQFLQFKHGAKIYPESLTNNYISNVGFFKRYANQIYGLTGTLGDKRSSEFLEKVYNVDTVIIPPFRKKQHVEFVPTISSLKDEWITTIAKSCIGKLKSGRAVLLITKFIKEIDGENSENGLYQKFLDLNYDASKILVVRTEQDMHLVDRIIQPGEVILTTNVAGRGTDIRLNPSINEKGGLHVCLTFLPINIRVEKQNTGRTSRTGNRGTSQLMLLNKEKNVELIREERDKKHNIKISQAEKDVQIVMTKEKIFAEFLCLLKQFKGRGEFQKQIEDIAVKERFALWLKINANFINDHSQADVMNLFKTFKNEILDDNSSDKLIKNPYFYVKIGNIYMKRKDYKLAIEEFSFAIKLDQNFAENAYYNRGYCLLAEYGGNMSGNQYYIDDAIGDFKKARQLIQKREEGLHILQRVSDAEAFSAQVQQKINLYNVQKQAINTAIGTDKDAIDDQLKTLNKRLQANPNSEEKEEINELIQSLEDDRKRNGVIAEARNKERDIEIKLLGLSECLPENEAEDYVEEIDEFERNGCIGGFQVTEIKPIDWKAVFGLMVLGLGQLIAGAALAVYTLGSGASLAMSIISEGISDIITAVKDGIINRDFSWASWAVQKAISLTIAVVCAGMSAIKDVASTCSSGAAKLVGGKVLDETVKSGWKLVAKTVVKELAKGVVREVVTDLANYGIEQTLIVEIQQKLLNAIEPPIREAVMNSKNIEAMLRMDIHNKNSNYENYIKTEAFKILDTSCKNQILNIAKQIAIGIGDGKIKYLSTVRKIGEAAYALNELRTLVPDFLNKLESKLDTKAESDSLENKLSKIESKNSDDHKKEQDDTNSKRGSQSANTQTSSHDLNEENIELKTGPEEQVKVKKPKTDPSRLSKVVISGVSSKMMNTIKGKFVNPVVQTGINYSMNKITSSIDATLNHEVENYKSLRRVIKCQDQGYTKSEKKKLLDTNNTNVDDNDPAIKKAKQVIKATEEGGKSGLTDMGGISDQTGRPIEVYDEKGRLKFTIGENKEGKPIKVQHHKDKEHYTMLGGKDPKKQGSGANMCLYNVISEQTGTDPDALKENNIKWMKTNIEEFSKQSGDISRLQVYDGLKLCLGGASWKKEKGSSFYLDEVSQGKLAEAKPNKKGKVKDPPPGHPRGHASHKTSKKPNSSVELYSAKPGESAEETDIDANKSNNNINESVDDKTDKNTKNPNKGRNQPNNNTNKNTKVPDKPDNSTSKNSKIPNKPDNNTNKNSKVPNKPDKNNKDSNKPDNNTNKNSKVPNNNTNKSSKVPNKPDNKTTKNNNVLNKPDNNTNKTNKSTNKSDKDVTKTGFDSYEAQNYAFELAMSHPETAKKLELLNKGSYREEITLTKEQLNMQDEKHRTGGKWVNSVKTDSWDIEDVRLVLGHQKGKYKDPDAAVFVTTFFPIDTAPKVSTAEVETTPKADANTSKEKKT